MQFKSLDEFLTQAARAKGPMALIFAEDGVEIDSTVLHHSQAGFSEIALFAPPDIAISGATLALADRVDFDTSAEGALSRAVNRLIGAVPAGTWLYYCFNAEYLFFPFSASRNVREMLAFHAEERRAAMLAYVIDLYAADLGRDPSGVSRESAHFDRAGYYALSRKGPAPDYAAQDRQLDIYGGLRWRFEDHVPFARRRIDRIALFQAKPGLRLGDDHTLSEAEMNTYACPWHNNLTAAVCSFRTAKALRANPGSRRAIKSFLWHNSQAFDWQAQQLMDLGIIEPGQWF